MSTKGFECPNCSASFPAPDTVSILTCPYCGYTFEASSRREWSHFFFPILLDSGSAWRKGYQFIARRYGVPNDFNTSSLASSSLHNVPFHIFHCEAKAECRYSRGFIFRDEKIAEYAEAMDICVPAALTGGWIDRLLQSHTFSVKNRIYFKPEIMRIGKFYNPTLSYSESLKYASERISKAVMDEAERSCGGDKRVTDVKVKYYGLIHYPFWELKYSYRGKYFNMLIDASSGRVIYVEYPLSKAARTLMLTASTIIITSTTIISGIIGLALGKLAIGLLSGLASSIIASSPILINTLKLKTRGYEEISGERRYRKPVEFIKTILDQY